MAKVLMANYRGFSVFEFPKGFDIEDKTVVKQFRIIWDKIYIDFVDITKKQLVITATGSDDVNHLCPDNYEISLVADLDECGKSLLVYDYDEDELR
jgi:hypothetical protein